MGKPLTYEKLKYALDTILDPMHSRPLNSNPRGQRYFGGKTGCNTYLEKLGILGPKQKIAAAEIYPAHWYEDGKEQLELLKRNNVQETVYLVNLKRAKEVREKIDKIRVSLEDLK